MKYEESVKSEIPAVNKGCTVKPRGNPNNNKSFGNPQVLLFIQLNVKKQDNPHTEKSSEMPFIRV